MPRHYLFRPQSKISVRKVLEHLVCGDTVWFPDLRSDQISPHAARIIRKTVANGWHRPYYRTEQRRHLVTGELLGTFVTRVKP